VPTAKRGEVWIVDLGLAAKVRPCLVLSVPAGLSDRALVTVVAHTTSMRGSAFEVVVTARFLPAGVFDAQNLLTVPEAKLVRGWVPCNQISSCWSSKRSDAGWDCKLLDGKGHGKDASAMMNENEWQIARRTARPPRSTWCITTRRASPIGE
jgi:mRNA interferase MazF